MNENENKPGATPASTPYDGNPDDLHDLFGTGANLPDEEDPLAALRNDPNYAALIGDLEYIASQARLLFNQAEEAPSDEVWDKIQKQLAEEPNEVDE
jgi:hypothetical protein